MEQLARRMREVIVASDHYRQTMAAAIGVGVGESAVLGHLLHNGPQTPSLISARIGLTPASTTALVDRMEASRLVERTRNPQDRRSVLIRLTDLGRDAMSAVYGMFATDLASALERAEHRLADDPALRAALDEVLDDVVTAMRERAGDALGVEAAMTAGDAGVPVDADAGTAEDRADPIWVTPPPGPLPPRPTRPVRSVRPAAPGSLRHVRGTATSA